jgi:hypothetical protein
MEPDCLKADSSVISVYIHSTILSILPEPFKHEVACFECAPDLSLRVTGQSCDVLPIALVLSFKDRSLERTSEPLYAIRSVHDLANRAECVKRTIPFVCSF